MKRAGGVIGGVLGLVLGCASGPERVEGPAAERARALLRGGSRMGNLVLRCEPSDADVYLDGVVQGVCADFAGEPRGLSVGTGLHQVDVKKDGYWPYVTYFEPSSARAVLTIRLRSVEPERGGDAP
ncbi:PEGA domain-containing protein [Archangium primigenium]|uniref:PEGA domain-containing protein n=1 Tax=[Archangium] primigenium TaxID=2792470 RepID=UPI00195A6B76|nr:PEGA domain-containing protein [Archangium primigenium]MBM7116659.1 PEGA domain-containing protein [Archangium primigenium]